MDPSLELLAFLTRSENRVAALDALTEGAATRPDLQAKTNIPRATLSRILRDFEKRDLAVRTDGQYAITHLGDRLAAAVASTCESVERASRLQSVADWIPLEEVGIDLADLDDATVTLPTQADPMAPMRRAAGVLQGVERVQALCPTAVHEPLVTEWRAIIERGQRFEGVATPEALSVMADDPGMQERARAVAQAENAELLVHPGPVPHFLILVGSTTLVVVTGDDGAIRGIVETDHERVRAWAATTFEEYQRAARPPDPAVLTP